MIALRTWLFLYVGNCRLVHGFLPPRLTRPVIGWTQLPISAPSATLVVLEAKKYSEDDDDDPELVPVRGGRRWGKWGRSAEQDVDEDQPYSDRDRADQTDYYDEIDGLEEDDELDEEYDDFDEDDEDVEEENDLFGNVLIPNPLLDAMDPDGAAERFPELAQDPRFWFDMILFVAFLDFLSFAGPRDPFPDIPWT
jgi:hypothetical protein